MNYRGYEIRAELRTLEQHALDDDGEVLDAIDNTSEVEIEGYYYVAPDGDASENLLSVSIVKEWIDEDLDAS
ncbi:hypothetical protein [Rhodococcus erythropolis]|uniref:Uncharacterized protein n=1 Tax=Rhodococcus erythropolis TaxID=1833 RepID=A0A5N5EAK3_RHOER|nr:hypothetical protein [Rhodococcus erythropolis]KAB2587267.1 hypothetical protein BS297_00890 [Rhodococcus erythropolis]